MADSTDWQNGTFFQRTKYLLDVKKEWHDCSFLVGSCEQKEISAHKLFLTMASPVFETMFFGNMPETFRIPVPDINPDDFEMLLQYIYTESVVLDNLDEAVGVHHAAHKYMIPGLMKLCIDRMWDFASVETACSIYEFAETYEERELQDQCLKIISLDTTKVLEDTSFLNIKPTTLGTILEMDNLSVPSELDLFKALLRWAESERKKKGGSTLRSVVTTTLPKIRFLTLEANEFEGIPSTDPLTKSELYEILMNIISPNTTVVTMPPGFSTSRTKRRDASSQSNDKYSWIKNMKTTQNNTGNFSTTTIQFEVSRKMQIEGVEIAWKPDPHSSRMGYQDAVLFFEIANDGGKPISTFFHQMKILPSEMKLNKLVYLERNNVYAFKVILYHPFAFGHNLSSLTLVNNPNTFGSPYQTITNDSIFGFSLNTLVLGQTAPLPQNTPLILEEPHFIFRDQDCIILKIAV